MDDARTIHLRRPPVLAMVPGIFVPPHAPLDEVEPRWEAFRASHPRAFDGRILAVLGTSRNGHGGVQIHVQECAYRFYAVQRDGPDLGVRSLGVKGIASDARGFLMGRRSRSVAYYPGAWEFVPGGGLEPGVEPVAQLARELREEAGLEIGREAATAPVARALLFDPGARSWEIVFRVTLDGRTPPEFGWEYDEMGFFPLDRLPEPLAPVARAMVPIAAGVQPR
jgi:8-oxo-dGTP pyrophosphatase MutT (NUDIX family)